MPMVALVASGSINSVNGSGISAGAPTRLITTATVQPPSKGSNLANESGFYGIYWNFLTTSAASGAASAQIPVFTWYDNTIGAGVTATGGAYGAIVNGGVTASLTGAAGISSLYGLSAAVSSVLRGVEYFYAGSGASGVSAYIQVSSVASNPSAVGANYRFDYRIFKVDDWSV